MHIHGTSIFLSVFIHFNACLCEESLISQLAFLEGGQQKQPHISLWKALRYIITCLHTNCASFLTHLGEILGAAIAENTGMLEMNLSWNQFRWKEAVAIAKGLGVRKINVHSTGMSIVF